MLFTFLLKLQNYRPQGIDSGRAQRIHLQLWDTAGQERFLFKVMSDLTKKNNQY